MASFRRHATSRNLAQLTAVNDVSAPFTSQQWQRQESQSKRVILRGLRSLELLVEESDDSSSSIVLLLAIKNNRDPRGFLRITRYHHGNMGGSRRSASVEFGRQESL